MITRLVVFLLECTHILWYIFICICRHRIEASTDKKVTPFIREVTWIWHINFAEPISNPRLTSSQTAHGLWGCGWFNWQHFRRMNWQHTFWRPWGVEKIQPSALDRIMTSGMMFFFFSDRKKKWFETETETGGISWKRRLSTKHDFFLFCVLLVVREF